MSPRCSLLKPLSGQHCIRTIWIFRQECRVSDNSIALASGCPIPNFSPLVREKSPANDSANEDACETKNEPPRKAPLTFRMRVFVWHEFLQHSGLFSNRLAIQQFYRLCDRYAIAY